MTLKLRNNIFSPSSSSSNHNNDMCDNIDTYMKNFNLNDIHIFGVDASTFIHKTRDFINITKNIIHTYNKKRYNDKGVESKKKAENSQRGRWEPFYF
jgi:outer membrane receptor for ferrienterochelin and colicin